MRSLTIDRISILVISSIQVDQFSIVYPTTDPPERSVRRVRKATLSVAPVNMAGASPSGYGDSLEESASRHMMLMITRSQT